MRQLHNTALQSMALVACLVTTSIGNSHSRDPGSSLQRAGVAEAVNKHFGTVVEVVTTFKPFSVVGDFNGDGAEDLAVVVRIRGHRNSLSQDVKLLNPFESPGAVNFPRNPDSENKLALVIIHSWKIADMSRKFLLTGESPILILQYARATSTHQDDKQNLIGLRTKRGRRGTGELLPRGSKGDVILLATEVGGDGLLYWNGRTYLWQEPAED